MDRIRQAEHYISEKRNCINGQYRLKYHMMPPVGWMNDPNGLAYYGGHFHLYYQFNPYGVQPDIMYWGHFVSDDLISYSDCGVAIAPHTENASIFSGGAVVGEGVLTVTYTLHTECGEEKNEEVYTVSSVDGCEFGPAVKAFDKRELPENISRTDFRDPCPVKVGDKYYVFVGGKDVALNAGVIVVLGGYSPENLKYEFYLGPYYELGDMGECPSYFKVGPKDVLVCSGCHVRERGNDFKNENSSVFIVGDIDFEGGSMRVDFIREIDKGDTFYAPQFISGIDNPVMIGWLEMWYKPYPTKLLNHGWVGTFSIPRELSYREGDIFQTPVKSIENYCVDVADGEVPACADLKILFEGEGSVILSGDNGSVTVGNDGNVYLDTQNANNMSGCIRRTNAKYGRCEVRVLLDVSSIEVFVDGGRETISSRIYIDGAYGIKTEGNVACIGIRKIEVAK